MGCSSGGCSTGGCSSGGCSTGGCNKLNTYDWLSELVMPANIKPFDVVEVSFKGTRKEYFRNSNLDITNGDMVVVELENGTDIGKVNLKGELVKLQLKKVGLTPESESIKRILRSANDADLARHKENKELEIPTMFKARTHALQLGLNMKLSDVEYQGDKRKATFYYTAEERVDFRELIKKLADEFKVRIEMKQIGYRQEAGRLGAIGSCGRELCCSTWLTDFKMVHINAARYQNLSINQLKLSGQCGKLKCCLNFELDVYQEALKDFPEKDNNIIEFAGDIRYRQVKTDILKRVIFFAPLAEISGEWLELKVDKVNEYIAMNKEGLKPELVLKPKVELKKVVELDFKNDMGMDSLTRLDERDKKRNNNNRNNKNRSNNNKPNAPIEPNTNNKPQANKPNNFRPNNPNQKNPNQNNPNPSNPTQNNPVQNRPVQNNPNQNVPKPVLNSTENSTNAPTGNTNPRPKKKKYKNKNKPNNPNAPKPNDVKE
ncbi:MAG: regulatory iron-sulfur-containing complex subunit RicT [Bacteroidota bacterium]